MNRTRTPCGQLAGNIRLYGFSDGPSGINTWFQRVVMQLLGITILLTMNHCAPEGPKSIVVRGQFTSGSSEKLILEEMDLHEFRRVDSITLDGSGTFKFELRPVESGFWILRASTGKIMVLLLHPGDTVNLSGSLRDFPDMVTMKGPDDAMLLNGFYTYTRRHEHTIDSLENVMIENQDDPSYYALTQKIDTIFKVIWEDQRDYEKTFIKSHSGSLASLVVLNYAFGMSPVLSPSEDLEWYVRVDSSLGKKYPENKHVRYHHQRMQEFQGKGRSEQTN